MPHRCINEWIGAAGQSDNVHVTMPGKRDFDEAIAAGQRNKDVMRLVGNWCANARIEKFGGIGMIEQATGLPIGHHSIACDFAPANGMASWDLRDAALDFYDRNCVACEHRRPVGLPNISSLVAERNQARAAAEDEAARNRREQEIALKGRRANRASLRAGLGPVGQAILDDIDRYDLERNAENFERLTQSARLAPEHFGQELVSYIFDLAEEAVWFERAALSMLDAIEAGPDRLARLALKALYRDGTREEAATVLAPRVNLLDPEAAERAVPAAMDLAAPDQTTPMFRAAEPKPGLLLSLWQSSPATVFSAVLRLLETGQRWSVELVGRGLRVILNVGGYVPAPLKRTLVATYTRAHLLLKGLDDENDTLPQFGDAITAVFVSAPEEMDALVQEYATGSDRQTALRALHLYARVLGDEGQTEAAARARTISLRRLIWAPTTAQASDESMQAVLEALRPTPDELITSGREIFDSLIGAILLLDDRLAAHDSAPKPANETFIASMERSNRRSSLTSLISAYIDLAAASAVGVRHNVEQLVGLLEKIPEGRDDLRGLALGMVEQLANDVASFKLVLPHLYHGLVGPSSLVRARAATALGELPSRARVNVPNLVYEAFCVLLNDPYLIVHKSAARAARRVRLPEAYRRGAADALLNLVYHYRTQSGEDSFLADVIRSTAQRLDQFGDRASQVRNYLVEAAMGVEPLYMKSDLAGLSRSLGGSDRFAALVARLLPIMVDRYNSRDREATLIRGLRAETVHACRAELSSAAAEIAGRDQWLALCLLETLDQAGARTEALSLAGAMVAAFNDTVRDRPRRIAARFPEIALKIESAIERQDAGDIATLAKEWRENEATRDHDKEERRARDSRSNIPFSS